MRKCRNQGLQRRNLMIPWLVRVPARPFMWLPQSLSQNLFRNQTPPQFMPVWRYQRADPQTPRERTFWRNIEKSKSTLNLALGPEFSVTDTAHLFPSSINSPVIYLHRHTCEVSKEVRFPRQVACCAADTDKEQRPLGIAFHLRCSGSNRRCEFRISLYAVLVNKTQRQKARMWNTCLRWLSTRPKVWRCFCSDCLCFILETDPGHLKTWSRLCASVSLSLSGWGGNEVTCEGWILCDRRSFYKRTSILFAKLKLAVSQ